MNKADTQVMAYIARCRKCRRVVLAIVDLRDNRKETAEQIAEVIREDYIVERVTVEQARELPFGCECTQDMEPAGPGAALPGQRSLFGAGG